MRQHTVAGWFALLVACVSCTQSDPAVTQRDAAASADAGVTPTTTVHDAGAGQGATGDPSVDIHFLLITLVLEMERTLVARCPCLTAQGQYESESECRRAVSLGRGWIDCANGIDLSASDSAEAREDLRCNVAQFSLRTECLIGSSCSDESVAQCMTQSLDCTELPWELLSNVVSECKIALSR